jgi:hypothetical protein
VIEGIGGVMEEIDRDDNFIAYDNGIVYDTKTDFEWFVGPDKDTNWYEAKEWVDSLYVNGGGWRMPAIEELKSLYEEGKGERNMTPLLKTTGGWGWSSETEGSSFAWYFNFLIGFDDFIDRSFSYYIRVFAVRSRR